MDDYDGYDLDDPKHPDWGALAADRADMDRKRLKEDVWEDAPSLVEAILSAPCARCGYDLVDGGCSNCGATVNLREGRDAA